MSRYATIISTGRCLPEIEVPNSVLRAQLAHYPDFVDKMEAGSGIRKRWYAPQEWAASDLALPAARQALERAGRRPEEVDLIVLGTDTPDYITPATSVVLQENSGPGTRAHSMWAVPARRFPPAWRPPAGSSPPIPAYGPCWWWACISCTGSPIPRIP